MGRLTKELPRLQTNGTTKMRWKRNFDAMEPIIIGFLLAQSSRAQTYMSGSISTLGMIRCIVRHDFASIRHDVVLDFLSRTADTQ